MNTILTITLFIYFHLHTFYQQDIQKNFSIKSLVELHEKSSKESISRQTLCDVCHKLDKSIQSFCTECSEFLCTDCHMAHQGSKTSRNHTLKPIADLCEPKQQEMQPEIKRLQKQKQDVCWRQRQGQEIIKKLQANQSNQVEEIRQHREMVKAKAELYHNQLMHRVACSTKNLITTLGEHDSIYEKASHDLDEKIASLTKISQSQDFSLLTETLETLADDVNQDLQKVQIGLPELDLDLESAVTVVKGKPWEPEENISIVKQPNAMVRSP